MIPKNQLGDLMVPEIFNRFQKSAESKFDSVISSVKNDSIVFTVNFKRDKNLREAKDISAALYAYIFGYVDGRKTWTIPE